MTARALAFLAMLSMYLALPVHYAHGSTDAGVTAPKPPEVPPTTTTTTTVKTVTPGVTPPMLADYTVLVGGALLVFAFFVRRLTKGWANTPNGGLVIILVSSIATGVAEGIQRNGFSKSVIIAAAGQAMLTFVAMSDPKTKAKS